MNKLKVARLAKRFTQTQLAFHANITASDVSKFELGRLKPYPKQAARLAAVLGMQPDELLDQVETAPAL